ncbi:hypothetical protein LTR10_020462 [Elasticomyces elasticus]|uniref:Zn(2)-C6 fungal-type domain-containing protein n=1 Tax=Exophiala sideris TaxID=1016849 RepID=A0ABR0J3R7_9EURO|nr:hypothetical protein LTR10_020462 [Elasticomyces elasticus]KAK5027012.1 hypothetical protein LTS07_007311 [Exophiala sideris]KAK5034016.1 hypothetical protein LTR13_006616 [Exophiala sideris]KAK5055709.1 hypothetical protein LTR69_008084 [Exophiala sideris]KAK5180958.1 hypothetical protein LTR44_006778 [Eurotiomycetes sp. CCFEE 6388]
MDSSHSPKPLLRSSQHPRRRKPARKVSWDADDGDACERCSRLMFDCHTNRPVARAGRKARLATGNRLQLRTGQSVLSAAEPYQPSVRSGDGSHSPTTTSTYSELSFESSPTTHIVTSRFTPRKQVDLLHSITLFPELSDVEFHLLQLIAHKQTDVDKYLIGSSFRDQHQQAFIDHLAIPFVRDAFIACAPLLLEHRGVQQLAKSQLTDVSHKRAAAAIASLRQLEVHDDHDLSMVLILGVALVTFATHHGGELLLCRHILGLVKPLYDTGWSYSLTQRLNADGISCFICLLGTETMDCLIRCELPTMKIRPGDLDETVDRFIGISAPLLTHFYELCALAKEIHDSEYRRGALLTNETVEITLTKIEESVTNWQPSIARTNLNSFTPTEVILMFAQAKVLRLTTLLVLHRLRYAFGAQDSVALAMANTILDELNLVISLTGQTIPFVDFAYLVSCFEITKAQERQAVLEKSHLIVDFSPRWHNQIQTWIVSFWAARDKEASGSIYWEDINAYLLDDSSRHARPPRKARLSPFRYHDASVVV